jgi:hypothetical protein
MLVLTIDFFTITLIDNIITLDQSIRVFNRYYPESNFFIICPDKDSIVFQDKFKKIPNVKIVLESTILPFVEFESVVNSLLATSPFNLNPKVSLKWYYQQILKLSFLLLHDQTTANPMVMWDADTIPLKKIRFFQNELHSCLYGSRSEFHSPYFETLRLIFTRFPTDFRAFTVQFFSATRAERAFLLENLKSFFPKQLETSIGHWIAELMMRSVLQAHKTIGLSMFSEQELVGISNLLFALNRSNQKPIAYIRWSISGRLTPMQIRFLRILGFIHFTYENPTKLAGQPPQRWLRLLNGVRRELFHAPF